MKTVTGILVAAIGAANVCLGVEVTQFFRPERLSRGDTNIRAGQPIDAAAWVWMPGDNVWGVTADSEAWNVRNGMKELPYSFFRFRNAFTSDGTPLRFDISADERFTLYLDGKPIARGPQRGLIDHWFYQSYEVKGLTPGEHRLEVVAWQLGAHAPLAQLSFRGGFILKAEGAYDAKLTTGKAKWQVAPLAGTAMTDRGTSGTFGVGTQCVVTGTGFPNEQPADTAWREAVVVRRPVNTNGYGARTKGWMLFPADRPDQMYAVKTPGKVVNAACDLTKPFTVPANTSLDLWWDLDDYYCAYPELETAGGKDAVITWGWTESLVGKDGHKGNRDLWKGKEFSRTFTDTFKCDGRKDAFFTAPWWRCGRWCRLTVKTAGEPLEVKRVAIGESRYPLRVDAAFDSSDPTLKPVLKISRRGMESCMHEMLFDCPYYEQQMYPGDTRVQLRIIGALTRDTRMIRFAMSAFDWDRRDDGMVPMNFPTRGTQESATYTFCWLMMFGDYVMWHDDAAFLRARAPGARASLMGLALYENADGFVENLPGWSFMDWVNGKQPFRGGVAPCGSMGEGVSSLNNLQYLLSLQSIAAVDEALGEKMLAAHWRAKAEALGRKIVERFWDEGRGVLADTLKKDRFSEHAQAMAIIAGILTPEQQARALDALVNGRDLAPVSSYFAYYLFEAYVKCGRADLVMKRFDYWRTFVANGARTGFEVQHLDTRSDCHGWSSSPVYFVQTAFAGVRPASPFFRTVRVAPQPAGLTDIHAKTPCPQGVVETDLHFDGNRATGAITLPGTMSGTFEWKGATRALKPGRNAID